MNDNLKDLELVKDGKLTLLGDLFVTFVACEVTLKIIRDLFSKQNNLIEDETTSSVVNECSQLEE